MRLSDTIRQIFRGVLALSMLVLVSCGPRDRYITISGYAQGGTYSVKFNMNGRDGMIKESPQVIRDSVDAILQAIDNSLSGYNRKSLVSRFNDGLDIVPDSLLLDMYSRSYEIYRQTEGAVDVAAAPLFDIWGFGFKNGQMPDDATVTRTMKECGLSRLVEDMSSVIGHDGSLSPADMLSPDAGKALPTLNFNAVAQGYSCDVVANYLYSLGVKDMMVNIGEIFCDGVNPSGQPWTLGIDRPQDGNNDPGVQLQAVFKVPYGPHGVVTSGNYRKFYVKDGKKYAHTIDPRAGRPVSHNLLSATVIAPDATLADAYATYCMVVGLDEAKAFIEASEGLEACLVYDQDGEFFMWTSDGIILP